MHRMDVSSRKRATSSRDRSSDFSHFHCFGVGRSARHDVPFSISGNGSVNKIRSVISRESGCDRSDSDVMYLGSDGGEIIDE